MDWIIIPKGLYNDKLGRTLKRNVNHFSGENIQIIFQQHWIDSNRMALIFWIESYNLLFCPIPNGVLFKYTIVTQNFNMQSWSIVQIPFCNMDFTVFYLIYIRVIFLEYSVQPLCIIYKDEYVADTSLSFYFGINKTIQCSFRRFISQQLVFFKKERWYTDNSLCC